MSGGVAGGPSLWTRFSHRREGDLPWKWLGDNPLCPNSAEFGNCHRSAYPCFLCSCLVLYVSFCDDHLFGGSRCGCSVKSMSRG
ncbi:hypothetical protein DEO72_LG6g2181 [Vigna unguiculata]|uniref:Uncharacterized protein n=1 Tax=Vigna unguiculata TaxID=3917 RepID=A0A4D6MAP0_VIGUN|nr:hypothetical protein DEO72_LG6g2181 [Vigna unguiculata]